MKDMNFRFWNKFFSIPHHKHPKKHTQPVSHETNKSKIHPNNKQISLQKVLSIGCKYLFMFQLMTCHMGIGHKKFNLWKNKLNEMSLKKPSHRSDMIYKFMNLRENPLVNEQDKFLLIYFWDLFLSFCYLFACIDKLKSDFNKFFEWNFVPDFTLFVCFYEQC